MIVSSTTSVTASPTWSGRSRRHGGLALGVPGTDDHPPPDGGLARGALHEVVGGGAALALGAAAALFAAAILGRHKGPVL